MTRHGSLESSKRKMPPVKTIQLHSAKEILLAFATLDSTFHDTQRSMAELRKIDVHNPRVRDSLAGVFEHTARSYAHLKLAWGMDDVSYLAWSVRNLLELKVWSRFITTSPERAQQFYQEWILDGIGKTKALREYAVSINEPEATIRKLDPFIEKLTELRSKLTPPHSKSYFDLHEVAKHVGIEREFRHAYKFLSNLVHPSPWLITGLQEVIERDSKQQDILIASIGINCFGETVGNITSHLREHGCEAHFPERQHPWPGGPLG